ncbi:hypothetical protein KEF85_11855 [Methylomonas paludis]|uniref:Uncharacterized protein n=1 Tax=Methylomonas paludis TaxID=1173101 RepID=A0A975MME8_9GAMM|nr:hypothetical protein [Methylomonas paludis]QWF70044.1 hypothetical protein KEF85_11855 [Methylomonas paludis]
MSIYILRIVLFISIAFNSFSVQSNFNVSDIKQPKFSDIDGCIITLKTKLITSKFSWMFRDAAECFDYFAVSYAQKPSSQETLDNLFVLGDLILNNSKNGLWWVENDGNVGDPNVNRFVLAPMLDGLYFLNQSGIQSEKLEQFKIVLKKSIDFQVSAYKKDINWDWGAKAGGTYPNQDLYFSLITALAAKIYEEPTYMVISQTMLAKVKTSLLPDGGFHYIGNENESPIYHALNTIILGRYYTITDDMEALEIIKKTVNYWPLVMTAQGIAETWSDIWLKQGWLPIEAGALAIVTAVTGDARNNWLLGQVIRNNNIDQSILSSLYAAPYFKKLPLQEQSLPLEYVWQDANIRGIHGRKDDWYFGFTQGRGLRNSFVGGLISSNTNSMAGIFRGAQVAIKVNSDDKKQLFLSDVSDQSSMAYVSDFGGALCTDYVLHSNLISGLTDYKSLDSASHWHVTQLWQAEKTGMLGAMVLNTDTPGSAEEIAFKFLFGPEQIYQLNSDTWVSGELKIKIFSQFASPEIKVLPTNAIFPAPSTNKWYGLQLLKSSVNATVDDKFVVVVWVGPLANDPPVRVEYFLDKNGVGADWQDGHKAMIFYNQASSPKIYNLPFSGIDKITGISEKSNFITEYPVIDHNLSFTLNNNECIMFNNRLKH